jgi:glucose-1-phosphatase
MKKYAAIIFDLGKVIIDISPERILGFWAKASGKDLEEVKGRFAFDDFHERFERGEVSEAEFRKVVSQHLGVQLSDADFDCGWCDIYNGIYEGIDDLLMELKGEYRVVALTNTNILHARAWQALYGETMGHFEHIFSSHEIGARKPERRAYEMVLGHLGVQPERAVFLDDVEANVRAAEAMGISGIVVTSPVQMRAELRRLGVVQ